MEHLLNYRLSDSESQAVLTLAQSLVDGGADPLDERLYDALRVTAAEVPASIRSVIAQFASSEASFGFLLEGLQVPEESCGPTPKRWDAKPASIGEMIVATQLAIVGTLLGEVFTWATLQNGKMIQDLMPVDGQQEEQSGHGTIELAWHTEDAFHPNRADYLLLLGVRNRDLIPTTVASIRDVEIDDTYRDILAERRFFIHPDHEHIRQLSQIEPNSPALARVLEMERSPRPVAVLFGDLKDPYLRIDPFFMGTGPDDLDAQKALAAITAALGRNLRPIVVERGSVLVLDNHRAVHGRQAFTPRFDGTDRWLKKISVTRDLRRSRMWRRSAESRVI